MRCNALCFVFSFLTLFLAGSLAAQDLMDNGAFIIYNQGKTVGSEEFAIKILNGKGEIKSSTRYEITHEARRLKVTLEGNLKFGDSLTPQTYELKSESNFEKQSLRVEFKPQLAVCTFDLASGEQTQAVILPDNVAVVDENMFCHWSLVLARFDLKAKGSQTFSVFVPQLGANGLGTVQVRYVERERIKVGVRNYRAHHYTVTTSNLTLEIWQDQTGRILRIVSPLNQAEVIRAQ
jgi:hypothetical protein